MTEAEREREKITIPREEYDRLRAIDAKYGWRERAPSIQTHEYVPHRRWPWFCSSCGYPEHERLQHPARTDDRREE